MRTIPHPPAREVYGLGDTHSTMLRAGPQTRARAVPPWNPRGARGAWPRGALSRVGGRDVSRPMQLSSSAEGSQRGDASVSQGARAAALTLATGG